jgi:hypothetical protein
LLQGNATIQGIAGVGSTNLLAPAGMTSGILETNATSEPTADPANAGALYVNAGEWKARGVGDGVNWRLKNLSATSTGSGSDYNLTASYANAAFGVSVSLVLPSAGTYSVFGTVTVDEDVGNANDSISAKIFNATDSSDVAGSERTISCIPAGKRGEIVLFAPTLTVSSGKTLQVFVKNSTAARGSVASAQTSLSYVRLY